MVAAPSSFIRWEMMTFFFWSSVVTLSCFELSSLTNEKEAPFPHTLPHLPSSPLKLLHYRHLQWFYEEECFCCHAMLIEGTKKWKSSMGEKKGKWSLSLSHSAKMWSKRKEGGGESLADNHTMKRGEEGPFCSFSPTHFGGGVGGKRKVFWVISPSCQRKKRGSWKKRKGSFLVVCLCAGLTPIYL